MTKAYRNLEQAFATISHLNGIKAILMWDHSAMMSKEGVDERTEQLSTLESIIHTNITSPQISDLLDEAEQDTNNLDNWQKANLREMRYQWKHNNALDNDLVTAFMKAGSKCTDVWRTTRAENDFETYKPYQKEVFNLVKHIAKAKAEFLECSPYDALIDQHDPGTTTAIIDPIFEKLESFLPSFIQEALDIQATNSELLPLDGPFPIERQEQLGYHSMETIGFNFNRGRLDTSHHPFCGGTPTDVRITTRYDETDFTSALMGVQHETGHAIYEQNLPEHWRHQPVGLARGMSVHESQSLLIEMQACRSYEFIQFITPHIQKSFNKSGKAWETENLYRHTTQVKRSLIRVDADEVTYPAHVILRYKLEKAILNEELTINELPGAWNDAMQHYIGITPDSNTNGCMQDIHWTDGVLGYFPTYTLGAIIAAQLFATATTQNPEIKEQLTQGNFTTLTNWLKTHIHQKASLLSTNELLTEATGNPIDVTHYINHLKHRYGQ